MGENVAAACVQLIQALVIDGFDKGMSFVTVDMDDGSARYHHVACSDEPPYETVVDETFIVSRRGLIRKEGLL